MKIESTRSIKWKEAIFTMTLLLVLSLFQLLQNLEFAENSFGKLLAWNVGSLVVVVCSAQLMEHSIFRNWFRCSFLRVATVRSGLYLGLSALLAFASVGFYKLMSEESVSSSLFWNFFLFYSFVYFITSVAVEVSRLVGKGFLDKLILGKYHHPKKEKRIFLFIDLKESTRLSKELSLENYSLLIKEFFREVDKAMEQYDGEIYQYAGDEVIVSWPAVPANYHKAVLSFLDFFDRMKAKRVAFEEQYGIVPRFKAAMHSGKVVGTWVGRMKRELVYQGEVLNIAARITGLAKNLSYPILLTQPIVNKLSESLKQRVLLGGSYSLKGVDYPVTVYFLQVHGSAEKTNVPSWTTLKAPSHAMNEEHAVNN